MWPSSRNAPRGTRVRFGEVFVDSLTLTTALDRIGELVDAGRGGAVFTPNVDHVVMADGNERFRRAYSRADLSLADGMPLLWAASMLGSPLPEKISGSDLVVPLAQRAAEQGWRLYLLGGAKGAAEAAVRNLSTVAPGLIIAGTEAPRIDVDEAATVRSIVLERIQKARPDIVLVGLGAPKQELWIDQCRDALRPAVLFGVGASIDFLAGLVRRAPPWMSSSGLEWVFRLGQEPKRLWRRYLLRDPQFVRIMLRTWRDQRKTIR